MTSRSRICPWIALALAWFCPDMATPNSFHSLGLKFTTPEFVVFCQFKGVEWPSCRIMEGMSLLTASREEYLRRGRRLEYFTIAYNGVEGVCSIVAGLVAGSVSLVGFGLDSMIEVASGAALIWRLRQDSNVRRREHVERIALRIVGLCFAALAAYVLYESISTLVRR